MATKWIENGDSKIVFRCSDSKRNIFLIGDSIRQGYCATVAEELADIAEVFYPKSNCESTQNVITSMRTWANTFDRPDRVDIVQFNCGHWDVAHWNGYELALTSENEYAKNIKMIIYLLRQYFCNAEIVFATTTPMNPNGVVGVNPRYNAEIDKYNEIAVNVAKNENIIVSDLNATVREFGSECYSDYCHLTKQAFEYLGKDVAIKLKQILLN
ncbi:MAG: SGNH/GDSL hydrolase family protein [Clostridia bacterium]|nr:SGNH/GDSL hydrolase family protein [Clostridia bacterium]